MSKKQELKVIKLNQFPKSDSDVVIDTLEQLLDMAKKGVLTKFIFAGVDLKEQIVAARANLDVNDDQYLVSFLQTYTSYRILTELSVAETPYNESDYNDDDDE